MNRFQDAREAIKYSSQNDTIAVCEPSCKDSLVELCDDYTDSNEGWDFWGSDESGEWRCQINN